MKSEYNMLMVGVIDTALWSANLAQVCPIGATPFSVTDKTARSAP